MFHVSTLLPHSTKDNQQLERKRHIGNDRVTIIFQDEDTPFSPKMIKSKLLHVFMVIQPIKVNNETKRYKVSVISRKDVPYFGPYIRKPYIFKKDQNLKHFLLSKLIKAEYASLKAPAFSSFSEKTIEDSLSKLCDNLEVLTTAFTCYDLHSKFGNSDSNHTHSRSNQSHNESGRVHSNSVGSGSYPNQTASNHSINNGSIGGVGGASNSGSGFLSGLPFKNAWRRFSFNLITNINNVNDTNGETKRSPSGKEDDDSRRGYNMKNSKKKYSRGMGTNPDILSNERVIMPTIETRSFSAEELNSGGVLISKPKGKDLIATSVDLYPYINSKEDSKLEDLKELDFEPDNSFSSSSNNNSIDQSERSLPTDIMIINTTNKGTNNSRLTLNEESIKEETGSQDQLNIDFEMVPESNDKMIKLGQDMRNFNLERKNYMNQKKVNYLERLRSFYF